MEVKKYLYHMIFIAILLFLILEKSSAQDILKYNEVEELKHNYPVNSVAFSPDGKYLATGEEIFSTESWKSIKTLVVSEVNSVAFSSDSKYLAYAYSDNVIILETENWTEISNYSFHTNKVYSVAFSPNVSYLASSSGKDGGGNVNQGEIIIYDFINKSIIKTINEHSNYIRTIAFSKNGKYLISGGDDNLIKVFSTDNWKSIKTLTEHNDKITSLSFSYDGGYLASSSFNTVNIFSTDNWQKIKNISESYFIYCTAFSKEKNYLAIGMDNGIVKIYDWESINVRTITYKGIIKNIAFSPNDDYLAITSENNVEIIGYLPDIEVKVNIIKFVSGEIANIEISIENKGLKKAENIYYYIYDGNKILEQGDISLEKSEIKKITVALKIELFDFSEHNIGVEANPRKLIKEERYDNNIKEEKIKAQPNPIIFGIYGGGIALLIVGLFILFKFIKIKGRKKTKDAIEEAKILIEGIKNQGIILKKAEEKLITAEELYNKKQYKKATLIAEETIKIAEETKEVNRQLLKAINTLSEKIFELNKKGIKSKEGEELFSQLKILISQGEYENAVEIAVKCGEVLEKSKTVVEDTAKRIREFENSLFAIKEPINIFDVRWNISKAKTSYDKKDYESANKLIEEAEKKLVELKEQYLNAKEQTQICEAKIQELKSLGKNTLILERNLREIKFLFDRREYSKVLDNIKKLVDEMQKL